MKNKTKIKESQSRSYLNLLNRSWDFVSLSSNRRSLSQKEIVRMPRPGPRPYECVRKAWHSDRHQPIRGSLIQEIFRSNPTSQNLHIGLLSMYTSNLICVVCLFRVVNEVHNSTTKKNKEWQEKLPIVVLKVEEIMYSKANSEVSNIFSFNTFNLNFTIIHTSVFFPPKKKNQPSQM